MSGKRVKFTSTGATGDVLNETECDGKYMGNLKGHWYEVRWDDGESMWVHSKSVETEEKSSK